MPSSSLPPIHQPRALQTAAHLRERLRAGDWSGKLPGERLLAAQLGVGRGTLRAALAELEREGWKLEKSNQGTRIISRRGPGNDAGPGSIGVILPMSLERTSHRTVFWLDELRRLLYTNQVRMDNYTGHTPAFFRSLEATTRHDGWVLVYPGVAALEWCLRERRRAVAIGTLDEKIPLPSIDIHYRALGRHAAGKMRTMGHRELALILPRAEWGSDKQTRLGFLETATQGVTVEHHNGKAIDICRLVDRLLARKPRPTAWLIANPSFFLTVMMHLQLRGVAIPEEVSLICRDTEPWQSFMTPTPTRYATDVRKLAAHTCRLVSRILTGHPPGAEPHRITPELLEGKTLSAGPGHPGAGRIPEGRKAASKSPGKKASS